MSSMKSCEGVLCTAYDASSYAPHPHTTTLLSLVRVSVRAYVCVCVCVCRLRIVVCLHALTSLQISALTVNNRIVRPSLPARHFHL